MDIQWAADLLQMTPQPAFAAENGGILAVNAAAAAMGLSVGLRLSQVMEPVPFWTPGEVGELCVHLLEREAALRCLTREGVTVCLVLTDPAGAGPVPATLLHTAANVRASVQDLNIALEQLGGGADRKSELDIPVSLAVRSLYQLERTALHLEQYYRLASGDYRLNPQHCQLNELFYSLCEKARDLLSYRKIRLQYSLLQEHPKGYLDAELVSLMFWELLSNAASHSDDACISLSLRMPGKNQLLLTLTNRWTSAPLPDHLFDRHAAPPEELSAEKGAGFGLSLVSRAVRLHGGSLVLSTDGEGSIRSALSIRMPDGPSPEIHDRRGRILPTMDYGLVSLSGWLPKEAYHPLDLMG